MVHRPFLVKSFVSNQYPYTRRTCVAAAKTLLLAHEQIALTDDVSIWTHTAFCVTAAIVLCLEILYRHREQNENSVSDPDLRHINDPTSSHRALINRAKERLALREGDVLAERAAGMIESCLSMESSFPQDEQREEVENPSGEGSMAGLRGVAQRGQQHRLEHLNSIIAKFLEWNSRSISDFAGIEDVTPTLQHQEVAEERVQNGLLNDVEWSSWFEDCFQVNSS